MNSDQMSFNVSEPLEQKAESTQTQVHVYAVSELNSAIRGLLESQYRLVWLKGEISNFKPHTSGHFYFSLKDSKGQISAVMFRGHNSHLKFKPHDGMEVIVRGRISVYEPRGSYQIVCELMEPMGLGALQLAFEQLKKKLASEGLFDPSRKRAIPQLPQRVAIVTSPTGAAIRDMINVLSRRFKALQITIFPTSVQGTQAPREIVEAISKVNQIGGFDVMIVGRGGGSIEDLWAFNEEMVARAIAYSKIPTISAVGHEIDFTIADFVADLRAPTPSAAAELVVKNAADLIERIALLEKQIRRQMLNYLELAKRKLNSLEVQLIDPKRKLQDLSQRCDELSERLNVSILRVIDDKKHKVVLLQEQLGTPIKRIEFLKQNLFHIKAQMKTQVFRFLENTRHKTINLGSLLDSLSPLKVIDRGYSVVTLNERVVTTYKHVNLGDKVKLRFANGGAQARIEEIIEKI